MAKSIAQTVDESVEAYIHKISKERDNVDACARLADAECRVGSSVAYRQNLIYLRRPKKHERRGADPSRHSV
jgi:hypothetical protein